jgi:hypothetical protein
MQSRSRESESLVVLFWVVADGFRRNLLKEDGKLEHTVASMRSEKEQADRQLFGTMDRVSLGVGYRGWR